MGGERERERENDSKPSNLISIWYVNTSKNSLRGDPEAIPYSFFGLRCHHNTINGPIGLVAQ